MGSIYDSPDIYDLLEDANRYLAYKRHWEHLFKGKNIKSMLDISIGSGSVTLPVLDLNITLSGSDLSENMLEKCSTKISDKGFKPDLQVADFRDLSCWGDQRFDVVASTGNAIAYVSNDDVDLVIEQMDSHVSDNGYICIDTRNWDKSMPEKLKAEGYTEDQIARAMHEKRRELGRQYKEAAPPLFREYIYEATAEKYGDPLGPTYEMLRERKTCKQIIESASRPIKDLDNRLTLDGFQQWYKNLQSN